MCKTATDTQALAAVIGKAVKGGEVITFISDLGGGKTAFVKGLAKGMGVTDIIQSPTFTISQIHKAAGDRELHHFDFYRLDDPGIMSAELSESLEQPNAVVAIEWGDIVHSIIPRDHLEVALAVQSDDSRTISVTVPKKYEHIHAVLANFKKGDA